MLRRFIFTLCAFLPGAISTTLAHGGTQLIHDYELNGSYSDRFGGPVIVPDGGTLGPLGYAVTSPGTGLHLSNAVDPFKYSIELLFKIDRTDHYQRLLDFKDRHSDSGLYVKDAKVRMYPVLAPTPDHRIKINTTQEYDVILTRNSAGALAAYLNGAPQFSFDDSLSQFGTASAAHDIVRFFEDDTTNYRNGTWTGGEESSGFIDRVRIYNDALTATEVRYLWDNNLAALPGPVPSTLALLLSGAVLPAMLWARRRLRGSPAA